MSGIFKPWYEKKDRALGSIKFMTNQVKLKEAALNAPDSAVRVFAASKISDKAIVTELIHQREYGDVAERALDVLQTREELTAVANDDAVLLNVRIKAAKKLDDEPLTETLTEKFHLVKAIQSSSESEVEKYVNLLRLDRSLIECVLRFNNAQFKRFAIGKIREDTALEEIIAAIGEKHQTDYLYYSEFSGVLDTAVQRIKAPEALERLSASKYECVRCSAVEQIKDPALLEKIAVSDDTPSIRYQAAKKLPFTRFKKICKTDPDLLRKFNHDYNNKYTRDAFIDDTAD